MTNRTRILALLLLATPLAAEAQNPFFLGLGGGGSLHVGRFEGTATGWNALATIGVSTLMQPIGLRLDVAYNRFDEELAPGGTEVEQAVGSATLNATYRLPMTNSPISPYLITGLGAYRSECVSIDCGDETRFGWNAGLGFKINALGLKTFLEARYHRTKRGDGSLGFFPVTLGLRFGD